MEYNFEFNPVVAWLNVNQACNMRCRWCYAEGTHYNTRNEMTTDLAKELVEMSILLGVKEFVLIGGEPTLWYGFFDLISHIKSYGLKVSVITNGLRFSDDSFFNQYKLNPASSIGLSIKSASEKDFQLATGVDLYKKSILGIQRVIKLHHCGVSAVHNSIVGTNGLIEIARKCKEFGATSFQLVLCTPSFTDNGKVCTDYAIPPKLAWNDLQAISTTLEELYGGKVNYGTQLPLCLFPKEFVENKVRERRIQTQCHIFSRSGINFDVNGNVILCNTISEIVAKRGIDYHDANSLRFFLNSSTCKDQYRQISRFPSEDCDNCIWNDDCRGGCLMNWFIYNPEDICHAIN